MFGNKVKQADLIRALHSLCVFISIKSYRYCSAWDNQQSFHFAASFIMQSETTKNPLTFSSLLGTLSLSFALSLSCPLCTPSPNLLLKVIFVSVGVLIGWQGIHGFSDLSWICLHPWFPPLFTFCPSCTSHIWELSRKRSAEIWLSVYTRAKDMRGFIKRQGVHA